MAETVYWAYPLFIENGTIPLDESSKRKFYKGRLMDQEVAVIKVRKTDESTNPSPLTEYKMLRSLSHQNIIRQFDFRYDNEFFYIPMELCDKNLEEYCRNSNYDERKRVNVLEQIGKGIEYLHNLKNPIVHGDLNPRNILIIYGNHDNVTAKITDFRTSVLMDSSQKYRDYMPVPSEGIDCLYSKVAVEVTPVSSNTGSFLYYYSKPGEAVKAAVKVNNVSSNTGDSLYYHNKPGETVKVTVEVIPVSSNTGDSLYYHSKLGEAVKVAVELTPASSNTGGSLYYYSKPPEALEGTPAYSNTGQSGEAVEVTPAWDIYAYGCLIQTILTIDPNKMHPYGNMAGNSFTKNDIGGKRKYFLYENTCKTDLLILADLAVQDATDKDSRKRPCITTLLNHPIFWNLRHKVMLLRGFCRDYIVTYDKDEQLLNDLDSMFPVRHMEGLFGEEFQGVLKFLQQDNYNVSAYNRSKYIFIIQKIRGTIQHRGEDYASCTDEKIVKLFGDSAFDCMAKFIETFPYIFVDLFARYRRKIKQHARKKVEFLNDNYHDYFKHLAEDTMQNNVTWEYISREDKVKNIKRFLTASKSFTTCAKIEWCLRALSQDTSSENVNFCKDILISNLLLMDKNYYDCIVHELDNLTPKINVPFSPCISKGCRYNVLELLQIEKLLSTFSIDGTKCLNNNCLYKMNDFTFNVNSNTYKWRIEYQSRNGKSLKFVPDGSSSSGTNTLENVLNLGNDFILAIAIGDEFGDSCCRFDLSEIIPSDNYSKLLKSKPQIELDHSRCLNKKCNSSTGTTFNLNGDTQANWRLECIDENGKKNMPTNDKNGEDLIKLICTPGKKMLLNGSCRYNVKEIMLKEILLVLNSVNINMKQCQNEKCHYRNRNIIFDPKLDNNMNWSVLYKEDEQEKEIPLKSASHIDLGKALRNGSDHRLYRKADYYICNCEYKFQDVMQVDYSILNSYINICGNQCLDDGCRNDTYKYVFDMRSIDSTSGDFHWLLEYKNDQDGIKRMHSFISEEMANLGKIWDKGKDFILHRSSSKFKGKDTVATIKEKDLNSPQPVYEAFEP